MSTRALVGFVASVALAAVLLAACSNGPGPTGVGQSAPAASSTPAVTASPAPTVAPTAAPTAARPATPTPSPTPPSAGVVVFCAAEADGLVGFVGRARCDAGENGFVAALSPELEAALPVGRFVRSCMQPAGDTGLTISVGTLCALLGSGGRYFFTDDPRPRELVDVLADGDLVPWCRIGLGPPWAIEVGPPCIFAGTGPATILSDPARLEAAADCTAGLTYLFELVEPFERVIAMLDGVLARHVAGEDAEAAAALRTELERLDRDGLGPEPAERAVRFFEGWETQSPIVMRDAAVRRLGELLVALDGDGPDGDVTALGVEVRDGLSDAISWFTAGRGC